MIVRAAYLFWAALAEIFLSLTAPMLFFGHYCADRAERVSRELDEKDNTR